MISSAIDGDALVTFSLQRLPAFLLPEFHVVGFCFYED